MSPRPVRCVGAAVLGALALAGCGEPARTELTGGDFSPAQTLEVTRSGFPDAEPSCPGDVIVLVNAGDEEARFRSPPYDTGRLRPGDEITLVLGEWGPYEWRSIAPDATVDELDEGDIVGETPVPPQLAC